MKTREKKAAILVYNYFEQSEFEEPLKMLQDNSIPTTVISCAEKELQAMQGPNQGKKFKADKLLSEVDEEDFDILVLPGGVINADYLRMDDEAQNWAIHFFDSNKLVAAICHAPWLLVSADLIEERRLTGYYTLEDDIRNAGGEWVDRSLVVDDNLITSRKPADLDDFNEAIIDWLEDAADKEIGVSSNARQKQDSA